MGGRVARGAGVDGRRGAEDEHVDPMLLDDGHTPDRHGWGGRQGRILEQRRGRVHEDGQSAVLTAAAAAAVSAADVRVGGGGDSGERLLDRVGALWGADEGDDGRLGLAVEQAGDEGRTERGLSVL